MKNILKILVFVVCLYIGIRMIVSPESMPMTSIRIIGATIIMDGILQLMDIAFDHYKKQIDENCNH